MKVKNHLLLGFLSFCLFSFASIFITYPLIFHLGDYATGLGDELVMAWIHNWVIHALTTNPLSLFEANLYYPNHHTLAFAESLIFTSILAMPIQMLLGEPIVSVNFTLISSIALLGFSLFLLAYYITKEYFLSLIIGTLVIFSPAVLDYMTHLQILAVEWVPLSILCFLHFIKTAKFKYLILSLLFFLFQAYNSFMPAYFIVFSLSILFIYLWFYEKKRIKKLVTIKNLVAVFIACLLVIPVILPYYQVSNEFHYTRDLRDAIHLAIQPEDLLYASGHSRLSPFFQSLPFNQHSQNGEFKSAYLGFIFSILVLISFVYFFRNFKKKNYYINVFGSISLLGLILSLGPFLHLGRHTIHSPFPIPLPYTLFYYIFPGFNGFRNVARWEMLFILCAAILIVLVMTQLLKKYSFKQKIIIYLILSLGIILEFNFPIKLERIQQTNDFPSVTKWLATTPSDSVIIYLPIYNWGWWPFTQNEILREYYSTQHFRKMVNGYTSFSPPAWQDLVTELHNTFPNDSTLKRLKKLGVSYIIVDKDLYDKGFIAKQERVNGDFVINYLMENKSVKLVKHLQNSYVFTFVD